MKSFLCLLFSATFITVAVSEGPESIPGTSLLTKTSYKISLPDFHAGVFTRTYAKGQLDGYYYVEVDNNPNNLPDYDRGGKYYNESLWEFVPVSSCNGEQWYNLVNKGYPNYAVTWSQTEFVEDPGQTNYIVLDSNSQKLRTEQDYLVKPVLAKYKNLEFYRLILREFPMGIIVYSNRGYGGHGSRYIMVDNSRDPIQMMNYKSGNPWYSKTLFAFDMPIMY